MADSQVASNEPGLVPSIVRDCRSGEVLPLAYMNSKALPLTRETGEVHSWTRPSGNTLLLRGIRYGCDGDALLGLVEPAGPACHTGERTCFHRGDMDLAPHEALPGLERTLAARAAERPEGSYTVKLLDDPAFIGA